MAKPVAVGGRSELPGTCSVCRTAPGLIIIEANGVGLTHSILCSACFSRRVREQRARRVTPVDGVPLTPPAVR